MLKYFFLPFLAFFILGCSSGDDASSAGETTPYLMLRAPISPSDPVPIAQKIVLEFTTESNETNTTVPVLLDAATITHDNIYIQDENGSKVLSLLSTLLSYDKTVVSIIPYEYFKPSKNYTLIVTTGVRSEANVSLSQDYNMTFTTANDVVDTTPLEVVQFKPSITSNVDTLSDISIQFNKDIRKDTAYYRTNLSVVDSGGNEVNGTLSVFNSILTFHPDTKLSVEGQYTVTLAAGSVSDLYGNVYDGNVSQWIFTTNYKDLAQNEGYKNFASYSLGYDANKIISITTPDGIPFIAPVSSNGISFLSVIPDTNLTPTVVKLPMGISVGSQINDVTVCGENHVVLGTMNNGVYVYEVNTSTVSLIADLNTTNGADPFGVACGVNFSGDVDKMYVTGPNLGLDIYDVNTTLSSITFNRNVAISGTPIKIATVTTNVDGSIMKNIYITDYDGALHILDENGSTPDVNLIPSAVIDLNGSTRDIANFVNVDGVDSLFVSNSIGLGNLFDAQGYEAPYKPVDIFSKIGSTNFLLDMTNGIYNVYITNEAKGVVTYDFSASSMVPTGIITTTNKIVASTVVQNSDVNRSLLITLDSDGSINVFNAIADTTEPTVVSYLSPVSVDGNVSIYFSESLDTSSINVNSFSFVNLVSNVDVNFSVILDVNNTVAILLPDSNLTDGDEYNITIKGSITDLVGNSFNNGVDSNISFYMGISGQLSGGS